MLKHVHISPHRNRSDSISLRSSTSFSSSTNSSCATSLCGSPEPSNGDFELKASSRSSSYSSLSDSVPQVRSTFFYFFIKLMTETRLCVHMWREEWVKLVRLHVCGMMSCCSCTTYLELFDDCMHNVIVDNFKWNLLNIRCMERLESECG